LADHALRWPEWFLMPELAPLNEWSGFRAVVHGVLIFLGAKLTAVDETTS
jgi:hypothetical protein